MPRPLPELTIQPEEFERLPHRLGWKHEYWDGKARLSPNMCSLAAFKRSTSVCEPASTTALPFQSLRLLEPQHESDLVTLFLDAFENGVEYCGYPDEGFLDAARKSVRSASNNSSGAWDNNQLIGACVIRSERGHAMLSPIMVSPRHQRQGIGRLLLRESLRRLNLSGISELCSFCHLGNEASMNWHLQNGFEEIPTYFATSARRLHHSWMARHFDSIGNREAATEHSRRADEFDAIMQSIEASGQQFAIDPFAQRKP